MLDVMGGTGKGGIGISEFRLSRRAIVLILFALTALGAATLVLPGSGLAQAPAERTQTAQSGQVPQTAGKDVSTRTDREAESAIAKAESDASARIQSWNKTLDSLFQVAKRDGISDNELVSLMDQAEEVRGQASKLLADQTPIVRQLGEQLAQIGPAPGENDVAESADLASRRAQLEKQTSIIDGIQREAKLVILRIDQLASAALAERRARFVRSLTVRSYSILNPQLWIRSVGGMNDYLRSLRLQVGDSLSFATDQIRKRPLEQAWMAIQIAAAIGLFILVHRWLITSGDRTLPPPPPSGISGNWTAGAKLRRLFTDGLLPAVLLFALHRIIGQSALLPMKFFELLGNLFLGLSGAFLAAASLSLIVSPFKREHRIAEISDAAARSIYSHGLMVIFGMLFVSTLNFSVVQLLAPFETSVALSAISTLLFLYGALYTIWRASREERSAFAKENSGKRLWRILSLLVVTGSVVSFIGLLSGYIALSEFLAYQLIFAVMLAAVLSLCLRILDEFRARVTAKRGITFTPIGLQITPSPHLSILVLGVVRLVIVVAAVFALLLPWGIRTQDWVSGIRSAFFGFAIGDLTISVSAISIAFLTFIIGYLLTRQITNWVGKQYLPATKLDAGMRNSITTMLGYAGLLLTGILAFRTAGFDLSNIALVAGALSVGIGFGMQSIVNNFISGLILLAERPIKTGDWVITSGGQGIVGRISVRSTEIETFDGSTIIVPNSTMITEPVTNWTHRNTRGRIIVAVGVGYDSDPDQVRDILLECAHAHPLVLEKPEPVVFFLDFGTDALLFDLRCYLSDIGNTLAVSSDLRFSILAALRRARIEIPFPQRDLHIKSGLLANSGAEVEPTDADPAIPQRRSRLVEPVRQEIED